MLLYYNVSKPDADSQYRLRSCTCGSDEVVYLDCPACGGVLWRGLCVDCGAHTRGSYSIKHDAQIAWNTGQIDYPARGGGDSL